MQKQQQQQQPPSQEPAVTKPAAAPSPIPRIVLLGTTGAGKSTTANLLMGDATGRTGPFAVSGGAASVTGRIQQEYRQDTHWSVVDTPGLGDVPTRYQGSESDDAYKRRCRERSTTFFSEVTRELRKHGGLILVVQSVGRLHDRTRRHLKAINMVLQGCMASSTILVLTGAELQNYGYWAEDSEEEKACKVQDYVKYVTDWKQVYERETGCRFCAVTSVLLQRGLDPSHPAHPRQLEALVSHLLAAPPIAYLQPGTAADWQQLIQQQYDRAAKVKDLDEAIRGMDVVVKGLSERMALLDGKLEKCQKAVATGEQLGRTLASSARLLDLALPGVGTAVAAALGGVVTGTVRLGAGVVSNRWLAKLEGLQEKRRGFQELQAELQARRKALLAMSEVQSAEEMQRYAQKLKWLVYDD